MNFKRYVLPLLNLWPPFLFAGIKIIKRTKNYRHLVVKLKLRFWSANYVGTQYGGSMFSMTDPFYMLMLLINLGNEYVIWDKAASIRYLKPGKTDLTAEFILTDEDLDDIRQKVQQHGRMIWTRKIEIKDQENELVAEVEKVISIKLRHPQSK